MERPEKGEVTLQDKLFEDRILFPLLSLFQELKAVT